TIGHNAPICEGQTLVLTAPSFAGASYFWQGAAGFVSTLANPRIPNASIHRSGNYSLTIRLGGCTLPTAISNISILPPPSMPIISSNSPICEGQQLLLTANTLSGNYQYLWQGPNEFESSAPNVLINNVRLAAAGTYSLTLVSGNCTSATAVTEVEVRPLPRLRVHTNAPVCRGSTLIFTASYIPNAIYHWSGPNGFVAGDYEVRISNASLSHSGTYNVIAVVEGCTSLPASINAQVLEAPDLELRASTNAPICAGENLLLTASFIPNASYYWSGPARFASTLQSPTIYNVTTAQAGVYTLVGIIGNCTSRVIEIPVEIIEAPRNIRASATTPICQGENIRLGATDWPGALYQWRGPGGWTSSVQNPILTNASTLQSGTYTVIARVGNCMSVPSFVEVTVLPRPVIRAGNTGPVCANANITLTATSIAGASYRWYGPNGFTSNQNNPVLWNVQSHQSGIYSVVASIGNCSSTVATTQVIIHEIPRDFSAGSNSPVCEGQELNLTASAILGATYEWRGPNGYISNEQNPTLSNLQSLHNGFYSVTVRVGNCYSSSQEVEVKVISFPKNLTIGYTQPPCLGNAFQLWAQEIPGATYQWLGPNGLGGQGREYFRPQLSRGDTGVYTLVASIGNCSSYFYSDTIRILTPPAVPLVSGILNNDCHQSSLRLWVSNPERGVSYIWIGPNGFNQRGESIVITNPQEGSYFVQAVAPNGCSAFSSRYQSEGNTELNAQFLGEDIVLCEGQQVYVPVVVKGSKPLTLTYKENGTLKTDIIQTDTILLRTSRSTIYELISISSSNGCIKQLAQRRRVTIYSLPSAQLQSITPLCKGSNATIPFRIENIGENETWILNYLENGVLKTYNGKGSGIFYLLTAPVYAPLRIQLVSITNTSATIQCTRNLSGANTFAVIDTYNSVAQATITSENRTTICQGSSVVISLSLEGIGPWEVTYSENELIRRLNLGAEGSTQWLAPIEIIPQRSGTFRLLGVKDKNGCEGIASGSVEINVWPAPTARFSQDQYTFCRGENNIVIPLFLEGKAPWRLEYELNNILQPPLITGDASAAAFQHLLVLSNFNGGVIRVKEVMDDRGCKALNLPQASIVVQECNIGCNSPAQVWVENVTDQSAVIRWEGVLSGAVCYILQVGKSGTDPGTWQQFLVPHPGTVYQVNGLEPGVRYSYRVGSNCSICSVRGGTRSEPRSGQDFRTLVFKEAKNLEVEGASDWRVYPNPTAGPAYIEFESTYEGRANYRIVDILGNVVMQGNWLAKVGHNSHMIDLSRKSVGIYFIEVQLGKQKKIIKLIHQ
ncbi:MAG: T9SS type A sorting domain-containing protein, partial [Bacteroidia bacterium]|nr:T9SS type A sorting domain-containing protein [Bacteroidia bacterium]